VLRALAIVHQANAGPGLFADTALARGWELDSWAIAAGDPAPADPLSFDAVMVFGGVVNADEAEQHPWLAEEKALLRTLLEAGTPMLGVCLGSQLLADAAGARVARAREPEIGWHEVTVSEAGALDPVIGPLAPRFSAFEWHSYGFPLPEGAAALAESAVCLQAFRLPPSTWGIQFHAEVTLAAARRWIDDYGSDPDAVRIRVDPVRLREQTERAIKGWNVAGRGICQRFLDVAAGGE
jgi:GMP synthase-like glutamine amidotransferase